MNNNLTLLIMAAGMGSRYGGLKQIEPIGPNGEFLIDYSIYDAIKAGFNKVVFVIKKENEEIFRKTVGDRVEKYIKVEYAFQDINDIPSGYIVPEGREKPWGTSQAVLCTKNIIKEPFAIINADDFYGKGAYMVAAHFLKSVKNPKEYCIVGYKVKNTLSSYGAVKRAVLKQDKDTLCGLIECNIKEENDMVMAKPLSEDTSFPVSKDALVSMNLFGLQPSIFDYLEKNFAVFLDHMKEPLCSEYLIPEALHTATLSGDAIIKVLSTDSTWYGVTYREDKKGVQESIQKLIQKGEYPLDLWNSKIKT